MISHTITSQTSGTSIAALIQRLPDELHPYIFREIGNPIVVSHVCRTWRRLVLTDPYLWSRTMIYVDHKNPRHTRYPHMNTNILNLYLTRSRPAPICVELRICFLPDPDLSEDEEEEEEKSDCTCLSSLTMIMDHISHIREFKFFLWEPFTASHEIEHILRNTFSTHPVPMLETLELSANHEMWFSEDFLHYPENAPALRRLRLTDVKIFWHSSIFKNLTELYLASPDEARIANLLNILRACPDLTILYLKFHKVADTTPEIIADTRLVNLPNLTEITLHLPFSIHQVIVQNLNVPQHANWYIGKVFPPDNMISTMCDTLAATAAHVDISHSRSLILVLGNYHLSLLSSHITGNSWDFETQRSGVIDVSLGLSDEDKLYNADSAHSRLPFFQKVAQLISALNVHDNITRFSVHFLGSGKFLRDIRGKIGRVLYESSTWTEPLLRVLPKLEHLDLKIFFNRQETVENIGDTFYYHRRGIMEGLISNLMQNYPLSDEDHLENLLCPNLRSLEIAHGHGDLSGQLIRLIRSRSQCSMPICTLRMTWSEKVLGGIPVSDKWRSEAKEYVERVIVGTHTDRDDLYKAFKPNRESPGYHNNGALLGFFWRSQWGSPF